MKAGVMTQRLTILAVIIGVATCAGGETPRVATKPEWVSVAVPNAAEMDVARRWIAERFGAPQPKADVLPFSFVYGGKPSAWLLASWRREVREEPLDAARTRRTYVYTDPATGLAVRCVAVWYRDYPAVEWTLYFKNTGSADGAVLEDVHAMDVQFRRGAGDAEFLLHHNVGSPCEARDYAPLQTSLTAGVEKRIGAAGGRSTNSDLSYFNLACGDRGVLIALGWPGQWESLFARDREDGVRVRAGQQQLRVRLQPGEEIRSPLAALVFWQGGDWLRAQNLWRRWYIAHNIRRPGGQLPPTHWCGASEVGTNMMVDATAAHQEQFLKAYLARGLKPDFWWMDAGWYPCHGNWTITGTWEPDKARFPRGFRPVTDALHAKGVKANLWFEPERVVAGTWLANERPQWVIGGKAGGLLNLGDPQCRQWLLEHIDRQLTEGGIDIYRQDFNMDPLPFWRKLDTPERQGVAENRHCVGLLAFWDELLRRHPAMLYDNCASGGRRNDLECMRRGVPYTKSDYAEDPVGVQGETYGISMWLPYYAATWGSSDEPYLTRSRFAHTIGACLDLRRPNHFADLPKRLDEWRKTVSCYWGDFWPLSPYSLDNAAWIAWQFDVPESGRGVVQAFRRAASPVESPRYRLRGLNPAARYRLVDLDCPGSTESTGRDLMDRGLEITLAKRPAAAIVTYQRID